MVIKNGLVSIIITAHNYADYIEQAIESCLNQTYNNIEIIIINDGSTDDTDLRIEKYKKNDNIKIVSRKNMGVIYTRNQGIELSSGDFMIQLDADDYLDNYYVEKCVNKALKESLDIIYTQVNIFGRTTFKSDYMPFCLEKLKHDNYMHAASLIRKSVLKDKKYDPYLDKLGNEDWDLFLDLCLDGAKAGLLNEPLLNYRKHTNRKSRADTFEGLFNETLVRHHIWSKQNDKHPDHFDYFSSEIENLLKTIKLHQDYKLLKGDYDNLTLKFNENKQHIEHLERRDIVTIIKKIKFKLKSNKK